MLGVVIFPPSAYTLVKDLDPLKNHLIILISSYASWKNALKQVCIMPKSSVFGMEIGHCTDKLCFVTFVFVNVFMIQPKKKKKIRSLYKYSVLNSIILWMNNHLVLYDYEQ